MRLLRLAEVRNRVPFSRASIYRKIATGEFPRPYDMGGGRCVAWLESEVDQWILQRVDGRKAEELTSSVAR